MKKIKPKTKLSKAKDKLTSDNTKPLGRRRKRIR